MARHPYTTSNTMGEILIDSVQPDLTELYLTKSEVDDARDGEASLLAKQNAQDALIDSLESGSGTLASYLNGSFIAEKGVTLTDNGDDTLSVSSLGGLVSSNDTTAGYLDGKLVAGNSISLTKGSPGSDETLTIETILTVVGQTGGGTLTAATVNELQDANTGYLLPLAASVSADTVITITQPDAYVAYEPVVTRTGSDTITDSDGTDTSITFDNVASISISLTSDGTSDWRL